MTIQFKDVFYETPDKYFLLSNINLTLKPAQKVGLIGANGVGKTTLARLIAGHLAPTSGVVRNGRTTTFLHQHESPEDISMAEYLANIGGWQSSPSKHLVADLLYDLDEFQSCQTFSGGEWMRIRIAKALMQGTDYLVLDEPSNNLDTKARQFLQNFIGNYTMGMLLISHDRQLLGVVEAILEMTNRGIVLFGGNWDFYEQQMCAERERLANNVEVAKREQVKSKVERRQQIERQQKRSRQGSLHAKRSGMSKEEESYRKRRAQGTAARVDLASQRILEQKIAQAREAQQKLKREPRIYTEFPKTELQNSALVFTFVNLNFQFGKLAKPIWKYSLSLEITGPKKVAITGCNGTGKSTLLRLIMGSKMLHGRTTGVLNKGALNMAFLDQNLSMLDDQKSVIETVAISSSKSTPHLRNVLAQFLFQGEKVFQQASTLSGGERLRLALAKLLLADTAPQVLLLDEPTNNIDVHNMEFIEVALREFKGALIIVTHDQKLLENIGIDVTIDLDQMNRDN